MSGAAKLLPTRELPQARLGLLTGIVFTLFALATAFFLAIQIFDAPVAHWDAAWWAPQIAALVVLGATWLVLRGPARPPALLLVLDVLVPAVVSVLLSLLVLQAPVGYRPELAIVITTTHVLVARAALMPSTVRRTVCVGVVAYAPICVATWEVYSRARLDWARPGVMVTAVLVWVAIAVTSTAVTSRVIYGLAQQAQRARRLGQYTLDAQLGGSGLGLAYRASHAMMRRPTAIKLMAPEHGAPDDFEHFERDVRLASRLTHPNSMTIYDYGRTMEGVFYYAMELLEGCDLDTLLAVDGSIPPGRVVHVLRQVSGALSEAHAMGLAHRDIRAGTVFLCRRGGVDDVAKIVDFGLVVGAARTTVFESDVAADLGALGRLGLQLLSGSASRRPAGVAPDLVALLAGAADGAPDRPVSASAFAEALDACADAGSWTEEDAASWWAEHGARARELQQAYATRGAPPATAVAVDWTAAC